MQIEIVSDENVIASVLNGNLQAQITQHIDERPFEAGYLLAHFDFVDQNFGIDETWSMSEVKD